MANELQHGKLELPFEKRPHFRDALRGATRRDRKREVKRDMKSRALRQADLLTWSQLYLPHHFRLPPSNMHRWLGEQLDRAKESRGIKLNVVGPRGSAKSTVATLAHAIRCAVEESESYIWIISDTKHQAAVHLENVRTELEENKLLKHHYPQALRTPPKARGNIVRLHNGVVIEAYGTGQRIRGKRRREHRPTLIICDDLQNDDHIASAWQRQRSRDWFQGTLLKAGTKRTNIVNLATALHRDALAMVLDRTPGWNSRIFKAIERWPTQMTLWHAWEQIYCNLEDEHRLETARAFFEQQLLAMHEGAELLWPEEEDLYTLMRMRVEGGRVAFEREKQGSPFDPSLCEWPEDYFDETMWFTDWPTGLQVRVITLDPSKGSDAKRGDYSAYVVLGIGEQNVLYVEADLARRATPQMVADGVELVRQFRPDAFGVESNQFQHLLGDHFVAEFQKQQMPHVHPWLIDNDVNKQVRIRRLGPLLAGKRLRFKANSPSTKLLVEQLKEFPIGDHDDGPDALEMALRLAAEMMGRPTDGMHERILLSV
jgi:predicted phage terminase large subunit-like protein